MSFKQLLENMEHHFEPGGKYAKYYALFEAAYTLFYTPGSVTRNASHVRDALESEAHDDHGVAGRVPGHVLGHVQRW